MVATRSIGASRNQASTSLASHHAPTPRTASSDARQTASAAASPAFSRSVGASPQSVSQKPPFRPLGPCPQTRGLEHQHVQLGLELAELPGGPEAEVPAADDDDVGPGVAFERRTRRDVACLLQPPAGAGVAHQAGAASRRARAMLQAMTAATATGTSSVQKSGSPPSTAPIETSSAESAPGGARS